MVGLQNISRIPTDSVKPMLGFAPLPNATAVAPWGLDLADGTRTSSTQVQSPFHASRRRDRISLSRRASIDHDLACGAQTYVETY